MIEIAVRVAGDHWLNPDEVEAQLRQVPTGSTVMIDMNTEGASITALGVDKIIDRYIPSDRVWVRAWSNNQDPVPYHRADRHAYSHFFWMAQRYWHADIGHATHENQFACLIGRATWPRVRILKDLRYRIGKNCLFSLMGIDYLPGDVGLNLDRRSHWVDDDFNLHQMLGDLTSIDGMRVRDQYHPDLNTNLSLATHYHRFDIEIVAESYCRGPAYLPTEKTIRPLLWHKSIMVYGPRYFLRNLRKQGFKTWSDWWDESYDELEGPERWEAMLREIETLDNRANFNYSDEHYQTVLTHNASHARWIGTTYRPQ